MCGRVPLPGITDSSKHLDNVRIDVEVNKQIASASKVFVDSCLSVFKNTQLLSPPREGFTKCVFCQCYCMEGNARYHSDE